MGFGVIRVPTDEYRFIGECVSLDSGQKIYIDPSTWCIHGRYKAFEKYIITESNCTAHLAQLHPFTFGWAADLHVSSSMHRKAKEAVDDLASCNPTLTVLGGDIVNGAGDYCGSKMEEKWFRNVWNYTKGRLSNNLWIKGNHDVDPGCYNYYDWAERLWYLKLGVFKFIGFDTYAEQHIIPGACQPYLSLSDIVWLKKRTYENPSYKVLLVHHPLSEWCSDVVWAFPKPLNIKCAYAGHIRDIAYDEGPAETAENIEDNISNIPTYINGSSDPGSKLVVAVTISSFMKDGSMHTVLLNGKIEVAESLRSIAIRAPKVMNYRKEETKAFVPIRLVRCFNGHYLNFIIHASSESAVYVRITERTNHGLTTVSNAEMYVKGEQIYSKGSPYDSWECSCGKRWNCYHAEAERPLVLNFED